MEGIQAHNDVLRLVCSCFRDAPASNTWDLSTLLVNGSAVSQPIVEAVLSVIYSTMGALDYEMDRTAGLYSLPQLLDMLLFADAVGCSIAVLGQLAGLLGSTVRPELVITLLADDSTGEVGSSRGGRGARGGRGGRSGRGDRGSATAADAADTTTAHAVQLQLREMYIIGDADDDESGNELVLKRWHGEDVDVVLNLNEQQTEQLRQQIAQQLEALLFVGFKLDLQQLLQPALRFLRTHARTILYGIMRDQPGTIFTQRVLASANGACGAELLTRACLQRPLGLGFGIDSVFGDVDFLENDEGDALFFTATLLQDVDEFSKGTKVEVAFTRNGKLIMCLAGVPYSEKELQFGVVLGPRHTFEDSRGDGE